MEYQARASAVHKSLMEMKLMGGVEKEIAVFNGVLCFAMCYATQSLWFIPVSFFIHQFMRWGAKKDPYWRKIYMRYTIMGQVYDPWPRCKLTTNERPKGFSRGWLC